MKFTIAICLFFTHYVCDDSCTVEKEPLLNTSANVNFSSFYSDTSPSAISTSPQTLYKTSRIIYNKRFAKRYPKTQRLLAICLQSNIPNTAFYKQKTAKIIQLNTHAFNPWLTAYLSLFALFRI